MTPTLVATSTHLFPGARLAPRGALPDPPAEVLVEFADGAAALAVLRSGDRLEMAAHVTAKGTAIPAKVWSLAPESARPGALRVTARLA